MISDSALKGLREVPGAISPKRVQDIIGTALALSVELSTMTNLFHGRCREARAEVATIRSLNREAMANVKKACDNVLEFLADEFGNTHGFDWDNTQASDVADEIDAAIAALKEATK